MSQQNKSKLFLYSKTRKNKSMGQSKPSKTRGQRAINVANISSRITPEEQVLLKKEFDRIQEGSTITEAAFRQEILGPHIPGLLANRIYIMFSSPILDGGMELVDGNQSQYVMTLDDFHAFYIAFRDKKTDELAHITFELLKMHKGHNCHMDEEQRDRDMPLQGQRGKSSSGEEYCKRDDLQWLGSFSTGNWQDQLRHFLLVTKFDPQFVISKSDFVGIFQFVKNQDMFKWVPEIVMGLSHKHINIDLDAAPALQSRLTTVIQDKQKKNLTQLGGSEEVKLTEKEVEHLMEFYNADIKNKPAKDVMKVFSKMFKDFQNTKLKKYFMNSVSATAGINFEHVANLVITICKNSTHQMKLDLLFDVFSKGKPLMTKSAIKDFIEIFKLPTPQTFKLATFLDKESFMNEVSVVEEIDFKQLLQVKPMMVAMTALMPIDDDMEREAILAALNQNRNLTSFIYDNLPEETEFYLIEQKFWDQWCQSMSFEAEGKFSIKMEHKDTIENKKLMEEMHKYRLKDLTYKEDFVLAPKYVFFPLAKWYNCDKTITRQVISYRRPRGFGDTTSMMSSHSHKFMMSSQKFYNPQQEEFEEELQKRVGDTIFELEVSPNSFYLGCVTDKGEKPHSSVVVNGRVDFNFLKKVLKTDTLPFQEMQVSRKTTLHQVLSVAATSFKKNIKRGRLLVDDQIVSGTKLFMSLEEFGMQQGQLVYAEFCNSSNEFPTDLLKEKKNNEKKAKGSVSVVRDRQGNIVPLGQSGGLQNMGNTCYMNSALQVIANIKFVHEYFIKYQLHEKQMNFRNPLGFQGQLAHAFAMLLERMWSQRGVVVPRKFKNALGNCCEQFAGLDQQDSQEYISFLIDGLHEELNLRMKKPYIENPESKGRDLNELGLEQWSNALQRNWSIIYFLFYGQMRSSLTCRSCRTESTTFDIFSNIPLSLPEPSQQTVSVLVYRVPNRIKDILNNKITKDENGKVNLLGYTMLDSERGSDSGQPSMNRMQSSQSTRDRKHLAQFTEQYNYMNNDQPMHIKLKVDNEIKIRDLMTKVAQIREVNIDPALVKTELVIFQMNPSRNIRGLFYPEYKLNSYRLQSQEVVAMEILTRAGREVIRKFYTENKDFLVDHQEALLKTLSFASEQGDKLDGSLLGNQVQDGQSRLPMSILNRPITGESSYTDSDYTSSYAMSNQVRGVRGKPQNMIDRYALFYQIFNTQIQNFEQLKYQYAFPRDIFVIAYHRRFVKKPDYLFSQYQPQLLASPLIFCVPQVPSGRRLYDEIWTSAHVLIKPNSKYHRPSNRWWERKDWKNLVQAESSIFTPFVLKVVDKTGYACGICAWSKKCNGCTISPTDAPIMVENLVQKCFIVIEWNSKTLEDQYNPIANEVVEHQSTREKAFEMNEANNYTTLDDCLTKFHRTESLENEIPCAKCKTSQVHLKKLEIFMPPPVLVIQLKRFRLYGNQWKKLQNLVDFPIRNLDLTSFVQDQKFLANNLQLSSKYDLHGIVNHYGTLGFGHYISFTKNPFDKKWYKYDDLNREEVAEEKIHKDSAYLLFYIRQDILDKDVHAIFPDIEKDYFPGKPIKTASNQDGFILEKPFEDSATKKRSVSVKLKNDITDSIVKVDQLQADPDKSVIPYTGAEMKVLTSMANKSYRIRQNDQEGSDDDEQAKKTNKITSVCCTVLGRREKQGKKRLATNSFDRQRRNSLMAKSQRDQRQGNQKSANKLVPGVKANSLEVKGQAIEPLKSPPAVTAEAQKSPNLEISKPQANEYLDNSVSSSINRPLMASENVGLATRQTSSNVVNIEQNITPDHQQRMNMSEKRGHVPGSGLFLFGKNKDKHIETQQSVDDGQGGGKRHQLRVDDGHQSVMSHFSGSDDEQSGKPPVTITNMNPKQVSSNLHATMDNYGVQSKPIVSSPKHVVAKAASQLDLP